MMLVPIFEIGLWNAWIFVVLDVLTIPIFLRIIKNRKTPSPEDAMGSMSRTEKIIIYSSKAIFIPILIYSFFVPLKLETIWFYTGLPITFIGLVAGIIVLINWANTPPDEPVTKGLYRFSRHPGYIASFVMYTGLGITCASWVFILFSLILTIVSFAYIDAEEQITLKLFGDSYRQYLNRTPRYIGIPKS